MKRNLSLLSVLGLILGLASLALAKDFSKPLPHYFKIRAALAGDTLDGVKEAATALAESMQHAPWEKAAKELAEAKDIAAARKAFGDVSQALIREVEHAKNLPKTYVFECPMAKPYGKWLQEKDEIGNPYYGSQMLRCGRKVAELGK